MPRPTSEGVTPQILLKLLVEHRRMWIYPMVAVALLAGVMTLVLPRHWKATQGLLIRPEAAGFGGDRLGKFSDLSEMKTIQETILELARSKTVVSTALKKVGPRPSWFGASKNWPTAEDIQGFRESMIMTPPGGAEFGKTEVFYLGIRDADPERAAALVAALSEALETRAKQIREKQARSMTSELSLGVTRSKAELDNKIQLLTKFETKVGANLGDMRSLLNPVGGSSETSQDILAIHAELRRNESERRRNEKLLEVLSVAQDDPAKFIATPSVLLTSQPALEQLKQGLIASQLTSARLLGKFSAEHPFVIAAREAELQVRERLHEELAIASQGVEIELALADRRDEALRARLADNQERQRHLASHRATYSQVVAAVENQTQLVDAARRRLADAQGHEAGAQSSSLLSRIDEVESSLRPVGPSRSSVVAAGGLFGLILGLGLIYLLHGPQPVTTSELDAAPASSHTSHNPVRKPQPCTAQSAMTNPTTTASPASVG